MPYKDIDDHHGELHHEEDQCDNESGLAVEDCKAYDAHIRQGREYARK